MSCAGSGGGGGWWKPGVVLVSGSTVTHQVVLHPPLQSYAREARKIVEEMASPFGVTVVVTEDMMDDAVYLYHTDSQMVGGRAVLLRRSEIDDSRRDWRDMVRFRASQAMELPRYSHSAKGEVPVDPILRDVAEGRGLADFMEDV